MTNSILKTREETVQTILTIRSQNGKTITWDKVAAYFGVSKPCVWRLVNDPEYNPGVDNCEKLGMLHYKPTQVCKKHGIVHCFDCETEQIKPIPKPRKKRRFWKDHCLPDDDRMEKVLNGWVLNEEYT